LIKIETEILQLITATWINAPKSKLSSEYIMRYWSIDTQWMNISDAEILINKLIENEWILKENEGLFPNININSEIIEFGWEPNINIHESLPKYKSEKGFSKTSKFNEEKPLAKKLEIELSNSERRLLRYISANTGILKDEVLRRCLRKKRALCQITITFCLLLIAKEQGMNMQEFIK
jgi:hypothetical protein